MLSNDRDKRKESDLLEILPFFKALDFFKSKEMADREFIELLHCLDLEARDAGSIVTQSGEVGDTFYIILKGTIQVFVENEEKADIVSKSSNAKKGSNQTKSQNISNSGAGTSAPSVLEKAESVPKHKKKPGVTFDENAKQRNSSGGATPATTSPAAKSPLSKESGSNISK